MLYEVITEIFKLDTHPSIEAMIVDRADEIAYMSHDIDDGIHSGLISFNTLKKSALICEILEKVHEEGINEEEDEMFRYRFSSHFINHLVYSLLDYSKNRVADAKVLAATLDATEPIPIGFDPALETEIKKLKKILFQELRITSYNVCYTKLLRCTAYSSSGSLLGDREQTAYPARSQGCQSDEQSYGSAEFLFQRSTGWLNFLLP